MGTTEPTWLTAFRRHRIRWTVAVWVVALVPVVVMAVLGYVTFYLWFLVFPAFSIGQAVYQGLVVDQRGS